MGDVYLARGTRDLLPHVMIHRLRLVDTVRRVFSKYGFEPLETPAFERIETLMGKYGEEGERLIFKILKRGPDAASGEADLALRYDLTVPLARVVAMHPELRLPFKRSQIQPVWRADRPQKGRFREFWQCDADTVGTELRAADAECLAVLDECLSALGFENFTLRINDRRILRALAAAMGTPDREAHLLISLDKLAKIGPDGVERELLDRGFSAARVARMWELLAGRSLPGAEDAEEELARIADWSVSMGVPRDRIRIDRALARGLDYYTGFVVEAESTEGIGSIASGGRYDELIGMFAGRRIPAVGISLGLDRIMVALEQLGMLGATTTATRVWVTVFSDEMLGPAIDTATAFRCAGIPTELSPEGRKTGSQIKEAASRGVPFAVVVGPDEAARGTVMLRDLRSREQWELSIDEAVRRVERAE